MKCRQDSSEQEKCVLNCQRTAIFGSTHWTPQYTTMDWLLGATYIAHPQQRDELILQKNDQQSLFPFPSFHCLRDEIGRQSLEEVDIAPGKCGGAGNITTEAGLDWDQDSEGVQTDGPKCNLEGKSAGWSPKKERGEAKDGFHHWGWVGWVIIVTNHERDIGRQSELAGNIMNSTFVVSEAKGIFSCRSFQYVNTF